MATNPKNIKKNIKAEADKVKAAREAEELANAPVTTASAWKSGRRPVRLRLPSGNVCEAVNKGLQVFVEAGKIPNALMPIVASAMKGDGKGKLGKEDIDAIAEDPQQLAEIFQLTNTIVVECVTSPVIQPKPEPGEVRNPEFLYVDELDMEDKMFVMNWVVGGTRDVERFRQEQAALVGDLPGLEGAGEGTE